MSNLVVLTPEEHFVAHQLLVKMYPQNEKLIFAANMMCVKTPKQKRNNKRYAWLKRKVSESKKGKPSPNKGKKSTKPRKPRAKETKPRKPRKLSEEHKEKIAKSRIGTKRTQETKNLLSISIQKALRKKKEELGYVRTYTPKRKKITP